MDDLKVLFEEIDALNNQWKALRPLKPEDEARLWKKFRLEWNYNSNHIEGNTLTYGQTELLVIFDKTEGDHELRELEEMKAHDVAIQLVREYASDKTRALSESDIRQWNKTILVRPFWSEAQTSSGQPTRKLITPGDYKKEPNSVLLSNGEMFHYASPEEVPVLMKELMEWYGKKEKKLHPAHLAALLHYKFVRIHPFDDSNGRTSRLLMNYVLLRNDLPPVIIKSSDKKSYLFALNKADVGDENAFVKYIAEQLRWSLRLSIRAAKGESIEDSDDVYKEIDILKKELGSQLKGVLPKSTESLKVIILKSVGPLFTSLLEGQSKLNDFFLINRVTIRTDENVGFIVMGNDGEAVLDKAQINTIIQREAVDIRHDELNNFAHTWSMQFYHNNLKTDFKNSGHPFDKKVIVRFDVVLYEILYNDFSLLKKNYSEILTSDEVTSVVDTVVKDLLSHIKSAQK